MEPFRTAIPKLLYNGISSSYAIGFAVVAFVTVLIIFLSKIKNKYLQVALCIEYIIYIICTTILFRDTGSDHIADFLILDKYESAFIIQDPEAFYDILMNVVLFIPLGLLLATSGLRWRGVITFGFVLSAFIELLQYCFCLGQCEIADVIHNTLGCILGASIAIPFMKRGHISLQQLTTDTKIRETNLLDWRLRFIYWKNGIENLRQLSEYKKEYFQGQFLCNEKAITNMTLFLNCVKLDWRE